MRGNQMNGIFPTFPPLPKRHIYMNANYYNPDLTYIYPPCRLPVVNHPIEL